LSLPNESVLSRINQEEQMFAEGEVSSTSTSRRRRDEIPCRKSPINRRINYPVIKYLSTGSLIRNYNCIDAKSRLRSI